jgi:RimJ/RimL family protein N-acetyltransferase
MKHNIHIEGFAYELRPVEIQDAEFIAEVRTPEHSRFMHQIDRTVEAQRQWLQRYFERPNEYYFVIERRRDRRREGLTGLLDFDDKAHSAQWGRLVLRPGSLAAAEAALLTFRVAFETFRLDEIWGIAVAENTRMIAYVESVGFEHRERLTVQLDGQVVEGRKHVLTKSRWNLHEKEVREIACSIAESLHSKA